MEPCFKKSYKQRFANKSFKYSNTTRRLSPRQQSPPRPTLIRKNCAKKLKKKTRQVEGKPFVSLSHFSFFTLRRILATTYCSKFSCLHFAFISFAKSRIIDQSSHDSSEWNKKLHAYKSQTRSINANSNQVPLHLIILAHWVSVTQLSDFHSV